jgi:hypothetical protein
VSCDTVRGLNAWLGNFEEKRSGYSAVQVEGGGGIGRPMGKSDRMNPVTVKDTTLFCLVLAVPITAMDRFSPL